MTWSLCLAFVGIVGLWLAGAHSRAGWLVGLGAQVLWVIYAMVTEQYGFIISAVAYGAVYLSNWAKWRAEDEPDMA